MTFSIFRMFLFVLSISLISGCTTATGDAAVDAGADKTVQVNQAIQITGTASNAGSANISYIWKEGSTVLAHTASFNYTPTTVGDHTLTFTASDDKGNIGSDTMTVIATEVPNVAPTANAGLDARTQVNQAVTLNGTGTDTDGSIISCQWKEGATVLSNSISFDYTPATAGTHTLTLTVTDNDGATASDSMTVTATKAPNIAPTANAGANVEVEINQAVTITGTGTDTDGSIISCQWKEGATVLSNSISFDYTPATAGTHTLTLTVTDNDGATASDSMTVTATKAPNIAPTANAGANVEVEINQAVTITGTGTDTDGSIISYQWKESGIAAVLSNAASFTYTPTTVGTHILTLTVTDNDGSTGSDSMVVTATGADSDNDFIPNDVEIALGMDQYNPDEDGDGVLDGLQINGSCGDLFFAKQWHIRSTGELSSPDPDATTVAGNDLHVMDIYHTYMGYNHGQNITVQVVDTGVDSDHEDLVDNIDLTLSRDSNTKTMGKAAERGESSHGTMCTGIIAARAFNGKGVRGIAPFSKVANSNWLNYQSATELEEAWTKNDLEGKIILASNSWGTESASPDTFFENLMAYAANNLRITDGIARGKLFIKAAGNGRFNNHDSGLSYSASNPYVITVAALTSHNVHASYSSQGSNILVSGYSGNFYSNSATIGTTYISSRAALAEELTYNSTKYCYVRNSDQACSMPTWPEDTALNYTYGMNGTSAATPIVAGTLALVLEACPTLGWRDVKHLIAQTAIKVDTDNSTWVTNAAGLHHSIDYGFGLINPSAMIERCTGKYATLPESSTVTASSTPATPIAIPDDDSTGITYSFNMREDKKIEWIALTLTSDHTYSGDLEIYLTSPSGTTTRLMKGNNSGTNYDMSSGFRYGSVAFMDEQSAGSWTIKIADIAWIDTGKLSDIQFEVMGH